MSALKTPPDQYSRVDQQELRTELDARDRVAAKLDRHIEPHADVFVILRSPNGSRFAITVDDMGTLDTTVMPS